MSVPLSFLYKAYDFSSPICATCTIHLIPLYLVAQVIFDEK
jgi:hypothetical protein